MVGVLAVAAWLAASPDADRAFRDWVSGRAKDAGLTVVQWDQRNLDSDAALERFALLCDATDKSRAWYLIEKAANRRWLVENTGRDGWVPECSGTYLPTPRWGTSEESTVVLRNERLSAKSETHVALRDGEPAVVFRKSILEQDPELEVGAKPGTVPDHGERETNFDRLALTEKLMRGRDRVLQNEAAIVTVLSEASPARAALPLTVNRVLSGAANWTGRSDASFSVSAVAPTVEVKQGRAEAPLIQLHAEVIDDDVRLPKVAPASERERQSKDHWRLWFCRGDDCERSHAVKNDRGLVGWSIGATSNGGAWSSVPRGIAFDVTAKTLDLRLPRAQLGCEAGPCQARLTICYSDADGSDAPTLVCTSDWQAGVPRSLGLLVDRPEHARYEPIGRRVFAESHLRR